MANLTTINIGIPAYNEGHNIRNLLLQVLNQEEVGFVINKLIVISDGSSDNTVSEAKKILDRRLLIVEHKDRKGKTARFHELLLLSDSEILIQLDADVKLDGNNIFSELVKAIVSGSDLAFPKVTPLPPRTYIEEISFFGIKVWEKVLEQMKEEFAVLHRCQGRCRAFSRKFYKAFILPVAADSVEDVYSFCFATTNGFKPVYVPSAQVRYRLPSTKKDFFKQARRFVKGSEALSQFFGKALVEKYTPTEKMKLTALVKSFFESWPQISLGYIALQFYARKTATMDNQKPIYDYVVSTKKLE